MRGLKPIPIIGARLDLLRFFLSPIKILKQIYDECGLIGAVTADTTSLVVAIGPEHNRRLLTAPNQFHNFLETPFHIPEDSSLMMLKRSLTGLNGDRHRRLRRSDWTAAGPRTSR